MYRTAPKDRRLIARIRRALTEVAFIVFLFYSNLLMGEFTRSNEHGKTLAFALRDIFTVTNFAIAMIAAATQCRIVRGFSFLGCRSISFRSIC